LRFVLGQDLDLFREEPAARFCHGKVGGAFERGARVLPPSESAQDRSASRMHQVIAVEVRRDRVDYCEGWPGTLDLPQERLELLDG
jgi:hypothetical protein